ncbi:NAD(P)H-dependent oxidoreductase [Neobacillus piezotolerans]|uniref:NAD(P)H-dependent oxidoreductase n=1 Tax=Neobacillus piezotolerans TaxID=2259171 RepID=A0A3D8GR75_9BACI|nr:NAD(P)H-dependent oxidoreductase [Neobacillus piezotolerans]RDU36983.1 NAD(P)H-dependent oxidoreductase [Neobacillus piezotolerans]
MNTDLVKEQVINALQFRHATKHFDNSKKISEEDFNYILEAGRLSPSSLGFEPWKFLIVQNPEIRERLKEVSLGAVSQLDTASHFIIILSRTDVRYDSEYIFEHMKNVQKMPDEIMEFVSNALKDTQEARETINNERALYDWSSKQSYIAMANMMTSAALIGIDSCPMEGFNYDEVENILKEENLIKGENWKPSVMVAFGYRKEDPKRAKTRRNLNDIIEFV